MAQALTPEDTLALLVEGPARIAEITDSLSLAQLRMAPAAGEWSAVELLSHLRACGDVWGGCARRLVAEERPAFAAVSPRTWIRKTDYMTLAFGESFEAYRLQRAELVDFLAELPAEGWGRSASVSAYGRVLERTVLFYAEWLARHERGHLRQLGKIVAAIRG